MEDVDVCIGEDGIEMVVKAKMQVGIIAAVKANILPDDFDVDIEC